jgi:prepilin-type N-terminal cleavage/methylation domain-containing protein
MSPGFTLVEVLVAVIVAGVIVAAGAPAIPRLLSSFSLRNTTFAVAQELRLARQRAVTARTNARITFSSSSYLRQRESPAGSNTYITDGATVSLPSGITVTSDPVNPTFDRRGLIAQPYTITVTDGTYTKTLTVAGIGRVDVQ